MHLMNRAMSRLFAGGLLFGAFMLAAPEAVAGGLRFSEGQWRLTVEGMGAFDDADADRGGDIYSSAQAEYEIPLGKRFAMGLRVAPAFLYYEDEDDDRDHDGSGGLMYGGGAGIAFRLYQRAEERTGWYGEIGTVVLATTGKLEGNGSHVNFKSDVGIGYQFRSGFHAAVKLEHISNAGIDDDNDGVNGAGLAVGYRF